MRKMINRNWLELNKVINDSGGVSDYMKIYHQRIEGVRKCSVSYLMDGDELEEYSKCKLSIEYFIENYCKIMTSHGISDIKLFDFQKEILSHIIENRFPIISSSRQIGMDTLVSLYYLHILLFDNDIKNILISNNKQIESVNFIKKN